jgi:hypothetical protein
MSAAASNDTWTSRAGDPFMCITLHYIPDDFKYYSWVTDCSYFSGRHTGQAIKDKMDLKIEKLQFPANVEVFSTHDNGSNVVAAIRVFKNRLTYDLKSNQIICQKYDLKSQSNHHFQNDLKSNSNQIVSPIGKLLSSFSYIYQPVF